MRISRVHLLPALIATGLIGAVGTPASAQESAQPPTSAEVQTMAVPPPLPADFPVPKDDGDPGYVHTRNKDCVRSLRGEGIDVKQKPWGQVQLRLDEVHKFRTGKGQRIAVIDTGIKRHPYFGDRLEGLGDYVEPGRDGLEDCDGHGTEVAGIIAASPPKEKDLGFVGVAPDARILSIRQSSSNYETILPPDAQNPQGTKIQGAGTNLSLAKAVVKAADANVDVINMSVDSCRPVTDGPIKAEEQQLQAALRYAVEVKDAVVVASAGNTGEKKCPQNNGPDPRRPQFVVLPPWFAEHVLSVGAIQRDGDPAEFSVQGPWVSVAAPGTEILSLDPTTDGMANQKQNENGEVAPLAGTSFAAPYVAGLAALVREEFPELTAKQVMARIKTSASHPSATGGRNNQVGYGMINPLAALTMYMPAEHGVQPTAGQQMIQTMPPLHTKNWTPMLVALIGTAAAIGGLGVTLFVVHTIRRNRLREPRGNS